MMWPELNYHPFWKSCLYVLAPKEQPTMGTLLHLIEERDSHIMPWDSTSRKASSVADGDDGAGFDSQWLADGI
jgi:hypothetical protein